MEKSKKKLESKVVKPEQSYKPLWVESSKHRFRMTQGNFRSLDKEKYFSKESKKGMKIYRKRLEKVDFSDLGIENVEYDGKVEEPVFEKDHEEEPENDQNEEERSKQNFPQISQNFSLIKFS